MAQFQPDDPQRPKRPPSHSAEERIEWGLDEIENLADRATGFSLARYKPSWIRWPGFIRRWYQKLPQQVRYRLSVIGGFAQTAFLIIAATFALALVFKFLTNQTIVEPSTGKAVFELVDDPYDVSYSMERLRLKNIDGGVSKQHSLSVVGVYPEKRLLQAQVSGVAIAPFRMTADGKTWKMSFLDNPSSVKTLGPAPSPDVLRPVYASDLRTAAGEIVTNKATVRNERAWLVRWKPTPELLLRMMDARLLKINTADTAAIRRGDFQTDYAVATVLRSGRTLAQLDTRIRIPDRKNPKSIAILRLLVSYQAQNSGILEDIQ